MNYKRKTGFSPSMSAPDRISERQTRRADANGLKGYLPAAVLPTMRSRRFHIGWTPNAALPGPPEGSTPRIYLVDREQDFLLRAVMSGAHQTELQVVVSGDSVQIRGRARRQEREQGVGQDFPETFSEPFFRTVDLPGEVDCSRASADFDDDVLEMTLPKVALAG